jgi:hypothetical protein
MLAFPIISINYLLILSLNSLLRATSALVAYLSLLAYLFNLTVYVALLITLKVTFVLRLIGFLPIKVVVIVTILVLR